MVIISTQTFRKLDATSKPAFLVNVTVQPGLCDINISPDKREVVVFDESHVVSEFSAQLFNFLSSFQPVSSVPVENTRLQSSASRQPSPTQSRYSAYGSPSQQLATGSGTRSFFVATDESWDVDVDDISTEFEGDMSASGSEEFDVSDTPSINVIEKKVASSCITSYLADLTSVTGFRSFYCHRTVQLGLYIGEHCQRSLHIRPACV